MSSPKVTIIKPGDLDNIDFLQEFASLGDIFYDDVHKVGYIYTQVASSATAVKNTYAAAAVGRPGIYDPILKTTQFHAGITGCNPESGLMVIANAAAAIGKYLLCAFQGEVTALKDGTAFAAFQPIIFASHSHTAFRRIGKYTVGRITGLRFRKHGFALSAATASDTTVGIYLYGF